MRVEGELRTYLLVLWHHKWMIAACAIIASIVALGISLQLTPLYSARATLRVASSFGDYTSITSLTRLSNTFVEIATRDVTLDEVAKRLGLQNQPSVEVEVVPETELIQINASDPDPARARDVANMLASLMVEQSMQLYGGSAPSARQIIEGQLTQAKADLDAAVSAYDLSLRKSATPDPAARGTPMPNPELVTLERLLSVRQQIYGDLLQQYETVRTNEQLHANAITILEHATVAQQPTTPRVPLNVALGLLAGLATGIILAFLLEGMDDTLRDIEDVQAVSTLPIMCQIPERKLALASIVDPSFSRNGHLLPSSAFQQLGARLLLSEDMPKSTSFLITSPEPGAGKSTVATNLAISLAEAGCRIVLLDMDFRHPRVHSILHLPNGEGLSDYLCGKIQLGAAIQDAPYRNLRVVTAGSSLDGIPAWLTPVKISELLERLDKDGDYVLIDAPALLAAAEPALIASQVDFVVIVVARRGTERKQLRFALQQLNDLNAKVVGIVVNKVPTTRLLSYYSKRHLRRSHSGRASPQTEAVDARGNGSVLHTE
jgi:polysaccharide biosynthesis transport protein